MAESLVVQFLMDNLKQLLTYNAGLFVKKDKCLVQGLVEDLGTMKDFVEDAAKIPNPPSAVKEMVRTIRVATYKAEDAIDMYVVEEAIQKSRDLVKKMLHAIDHPIKIRSVAEELHDVRTTVQAIYDEDGYGFGALLPQVDASSNSPKMFTRSFVEEENVVGFEDSAHKLIRRLIRGTPDLQVISIVGMAGLGKTTLARKIYTDPKVTSEFSSRAWSYRSQTHKKREVLLDILSGVVDQVTPAMRTMTDGELVIKVKQSLIWRYLVVVDDVWTPEDWEKLKGAFPDHKNGSRILLTSRNMEVALYANPNRSSPPHILKFLTKNESWELLQKKVFGREPCPLELVSVGKQIAEDCKGLPLAIVVVAGILWGKAEQTWEHVESGLTRYIMTETNQLMEVLAVSYNQLPYHLKSCFLYFGVFPDDFEIPVWKLIRLWIAEGFVEKTDNLCLEDRAKEILEELVGRNMVMVSQRSLLGQIKTCRVHDMLRHLCLAKAEEENFFYELKTAYGYGPTVSNTYRRLCIHSRILDFIASKPSGELVRSFLCFNSLEENKELPRDYISYLPQGFPLLRVFDIQPISFSIFPTKLIQLALLRYLAISGNFKILPSAVSNLGNLQTLIVETTEPTIDIHADISKMIHLRHVHTSGASKLSGLPTRETTPSPRKHEGSSVSNNNLQTLSAILPESCTRNVLSRIPNIKKLGIRGKLSILVEGKGGSDSFYLPLFGKLEKLKLVNEVDGKLSGLPKSIELLPSLKKLTLQDTFLDWKHMSVLGMLPKLEVLKLRDYAFVGEKWNLPDERGFCRLKVLHIGKTNLEQWEASTDSFPMIERIVVKGCESLITLPSALGEVFTLQMIELHHASPSAVDSAKEIQQQHLSYTGDDRLQVNIYNPQHNTSAS